MLVVLREGQHHAPLYFFPGAAGSASELSNLAKTLSTDSDVIAMEFLAPWKAASAFPSVEEMGACCARALLSAQPEGALRLSGYSFGGLVALETARVLMQAGRSVAPLVLIDTVYDDSLWPRRMLYAALLRRGLWHLRNLGAEPPSLTEIRQRLRRLWNRFRRIPVNAPASSSANLSPQEISIAAMQNYRPVALDGAAVLMNAADDSDFAVDPAALWRPFLRGMRVVRVAGSHATLLRDRNSLRETATAIDRIMCEPPAPAIQTSPRPVVLLAAAFRWFSTVRLALDLHEAGFEVHVLCPPGHPIEPVSFVKRVYRYRPLAPAASLLNAIGAAKPRLVVPCDDAIAGEIHSLCQHRPADAALQTLVRDSLGAPECLHLFYSRAAIASMARELGIACPPAIAVENPAESVEALHAMNSRAMMKSDRSWGGTGVVEVSSAAEARAAFRKLAAAPGPLRTLKRALMDKDSNSVLDCLRRKPRSVSLHAFVDGQPANAAVACFRGDVLGCVSARVLQSDGPKGPATVIEIVDPPEMRRAVTLMVKRLGLSGLVGFDFIISNDGTVRMIEMNPRATPTSHLIPQDGHGLCQALHAAVTGHLPQTRKPYIAGAILLFPQELTRDPASPYLGMGHHDLPVSSPEILDIGLASCRHKTRRNAFARAPVAREEK